MFVAIRCLVRLNFEDWSQPISREMPEFVIAKHVPENTVFEIDCSIDDVKRIVNFAYGCGSWTSFESRVEGNTYLYMYSPHDVHEMRCDYETVSLNKEFVVSATLTFSEHSDFVKKECDLPHLFRTAASFEELSADDVKGLLEYNNKMLIYNSQTHDYDIRREMLREWRISDAERHMAQYAFISQCMQLDRADVKSYAEGIDEIYQKQMLKTNEQIFEEYMQIRGLDRDQQTCS